MLANGAHLVVLLQLLPVPIIGVQTRLASESERKSALGRMNRVGVTEYQHHEFKRSTRTNGKFAWPDPANREGQLFSGATDLTDNVSWGWHHPNGIFNTIPVGSPLIDDQSNIYAAADDAIRKFNMMGDILWSYAPRGQLAAAPTLFTGSSSRRLGARMKNDMSAEAEDLLRPDWAKDSTSNTEPSFQYFKDFKIGDVVKVKPGLSYRADGKELYKEGDQGLISGFADSRAIIQWSRTGHRSVLDLHAMKNRFVRVQAKEEQDSLPPMIVGSTTSGYVFAIDLDSGEELWATWASNAIVGVKGAVAAKDGIVVVATDQCTDRYCYRYRNLTGPLWHGNSVVRGLSAADGSAVWEYRTMAPVWNMVPLWGPSSNVYFQDYEGRLYNLDLQTGALIWRVGGNIGTFTQATAVYSPGHNMVYAMGVDYYQSKYCNPYVAPGILVNCNTWPGVAGWVRGYNATSGRQRWETSTPEPPASAAVGMLNSPAGHTRLVVTLGYNCRINSPTQIWSIDPHSGHVRWLRDGPTLWSNQCAGDREGADIRRTMGGRAVCTPNSWSAPAIDSHGDVYVGNQVGVLQRWGSTDGTTRNVSLLSTLTTGHAFQDAAIAFGDGIMAVSTCTSLIVLQTYTSYFTEDVTVTAAPNVDGEPYGYNQNLTATTQSP